MVLKDWILLLIPILFNGLIVYCVQRHFDKLKIVREAKLQYYNEMRRLVDLVLADYVELSTLSRTGTDCNERILQYVEMVQSASDYYDKNKGILTCLDDDFTKLCSYWNNFTEYWNNTAETDREGARLSAALREINVQMRIIQRKCVEYDKI